MIGRLRGVRATSVAYLLSRFPGTLGYRMRRWYLGRRLGHLRRGAGFGTGSNTNSAIILEEYLRHQGLVERVAGISMLGRKHLRRRLLSRCPICHSDDYHPLIRLPLGWPTGGVYSLLYFDYSGVDLTHLLPVKDTLDKTLGFVLSVPWSFCNRCENGSLALEMSQGHLDIYYSRYYEPSRPDRVPTQVRQATKELPGQYFCRFLSPGSRVLEIGAAEGFTSEYVASQGHDMMVCEPSVNFHNRLKNLPGVTLISADLSSVPGGSLDAIYLHHVLEHTASPLEYAKGLHRMRSPGGLLLIQVPDLSLGLMHYQRQARPSIYSLLNPPAVFSRHIQYDFLSVKNSYDWFTSLENDHQSAFTPEGLRYVIEQSGFEVEQSVQSTADTVTFDPRYAWPLDVSTGNYPNSLSLVARK